MLSERGALVLLINQAGQGGVYKQLLAILLVKRVWLLPSLADFLLVVSCTDSGGGVTFPLNL